MAAEAPGRPSNRDCSLQGRSDIFSQGLLLHQHISDRVALRPAGSSTLAVGERKCQLRGRRLGTIPPLTETSRALQARNAKSRKCLPGPLAPEPRKVSKESREESPTLSRDSPETSQTVPETFWGSGAKRPRETFSRLFGGGGLVSRAPRWALRIFCTTVIVFSMLGGLAHGGQQSEKTGPMVFGQGKEKRIPVQSPPFSKRPCNGKKWPVRMNLRSYVPGKGGGFQNRAKRKNRKVPSGRYWYENLFFQLDICFDAALHVEYFPGFRAHPHSSIC